MERHIKTEAAVIGVRKFGELHKSVTLFSPASGLINAVIYGGRKGKKTALAPLFSYGLFQLYHDPVKNTYSLTEESSSFTAVSITQNIEAYYTALYFCEACSLVKTDDPSLMYGLLTSALAALEKKTSMHRKVLIDFTWKLLVSSGLVSDINTCPSCDRKYGEDEVLHFSSSMAVPVCADCADSDIIRLTPGARRYLSYTFDMSLEDALEVELYSTAAQRLSHFLLQWMEAFCQRPLKTVQSGLL